MFVCYVQHAKNEKRFLFDCTEFVRDKAAGEVIKGTRVICETRRGEQEATITHGPICIGCLDGVDERYIISRMCGTYPLKKILRLAPKKPELTADEKKQIAMEWLLTEAKK